MRSDRIRFAVPLVLLVVVAVRVVYKLTLAHVDPAVSSVDYNFVRTLVAPRGYIYDCNGQVLAAPELIWEYRLDPVHLTNAVVREHIKMPPRTPAAILRTIARALHLNRDELVDKSRKVGSRYQFLACSADRRVHDLLADKTKVAGVVIEDRLRRKYLTPSLASHVVGSVNSKGEGSSGLELRFDNILKGRSGEIHGKKDASGHEIYAKRVVSVEPVAGADIYLTIDRRLQYEAEDVLRRGVAEYGASAGWCIVMDAKTGAVLVMASLPGFDSAEFGRADEESKVNRACAYNYEPGSVMKVITTAIGLEQGVCQPGTLYTTNRDDDRYYRLPGDGRHVWEPRMTVADAVVHSSNIVIGKLGVDIGPNRLYEGMRKFGFGQKTGLGLPGEETGMLPNWKRWDKVKWSRAPIGQGVAVTAIQLCSAYQAIANDGIRMRPHIVSRIELANGETYYEHQNEAVSQPISAATARQLREIMMGVATPAGTAQQAAIPGYTVAGKTGTAQKVVNGKYDDRLFWATFCGIVPAAEPRLVVLVTLDFNEPRRFHQGGNSAGPLFRRLTTALLRHLRIPPDRPDELVEPKGDEYEDMVRERLDAQTAAR